MVPSVKWVTWWKRGLRGIWTVKAQISFCVNTVCSGSSLDTGSLNTKDISTNSRGHGQAVQIIRLSRTFDSCLHLPLISCQSWGIFNILQRKHNLIYTKYLDKQAKQQIVQIQIRCSRMWHLIRIYTVVVKWSSRFRNIVFNYLV